MSLQVFQRLLLLMYTDEQILDEYIKDADSLLLEFSLTEREKRALRGLSTKEIFRFARELRHKRISVSRKIISAAPLNSSPVFLFPSHRFGHTLFFKTTYGEYEIPITAGSFHLLSEFIHTNAKIHVADIMKTYQDSDTTCSVRDLFQIITLIFRHKLYGRTLRKLS